MSGRAPLTVEFDLGRGGRWTSLRSPGREWLWRHPDPTVHTARLHVPPGQSFVDAGGGEECFPTLQGVPDHGDVWSRRWHAGGSAASTRTGPFDLARTLTSTDAGAQLDYEIAGPPGAPFLHAVHLLLDLDVGARIELAAGVPMLVAGEPGDHVWPLLDGVDQSVLGPDDGSARCLVLPGVSRCQISDSRGSLSLSWRRTAGDGPGVGLVLWRNLGGWPVGPDSIGPYRSIGIEPLLGAGVNHTVADDCSRLDDSGRASWELTISVDGRPVADHVPSQSSDLPHIAPSQRT